MGRHSRESVESYHLQIEAMKLAFADTRAYVADPDKAQVPVAGMLDRDYARERARLIGETAMEPQPGRHQEAARSISARRTLMA
jgi:gamma-glutamyltranspeptidase/glutathione hydrolase